MFFDPVAVNHPLLLLLLLLVLRLRLTRTACTKIGVGAELNHPRRVPNGSPPRRWWYFSLLEKKIQTGLLVLRADKTLLGDFVWRVKDSLEVEVIEQEVDITGDENEREARMVPNMQHAKHRLPRIDAGAKVWPRDSTEIFL